VLIYCIKVYKTLKFFLCSLSDLCVVFNAQLPPVNPELIGDILFPEVGDTQILIPANAIIHQRRTEGK